MFKLQIEVDSIEEAERILACLRHDAGPNAVKQVERQIPFHAPGGLSDEESPAAKYFPETTNTATKNPTAEKPKNPRGRPRREVAPPIQESAAPESPAEAEAAEAVQQPDVQPAQQTYTAADVRAALQAVLTDKDMAACTAILSKFNAARVSELAPEQYADFVAACKAA